jgi:hypothetical protein
MTRLRPLVVPATAFALAAAVPSAASAQPRRPVHLPTVRALTPGLASPAADHADIRVGATPVRAAMSPLPVAALPTRGEAAAPGGRHAVAPPPAGATAAGRPIPAVARGPPA